MIPALLFAVGLSLREFADSLIVGRLLSEDAFAIVNLGTPIVFMASMVYTITGLGGSLLYAEYLAKKEKERADTYFTASMLLALSTGLILFARLMLFRARLAARRWSSGNLSFSCTLRRITRSAAGGIRV